MKKDRNQRIEIINQIIKEIASRGRDFLNSKEHNRTSYFVWDGRTLWFIDYYTGIPLAMRKGSSYPTKKQEYSFSGGGTLWSLVNDFKDFIFGNDNSNGKNGYGGLYCTHWGWSEEGMEKMRDYAREIGYLKVS